MASSTRETSSGRPTSTSRIITLIPSWPGEDALCWKARGNDFKPFMQGEPRMEEFIRILLGEKLEQYLYKARCIAGEKVERRIACVLLKVVKDRGIFEGCNARLDVTLTNRDIAGAGRIHRGDRLARDEPAEEGTDHRHGRQVPAGERPGGACTAT